MIKLHNFVEPCLSLFGHISCWENHICSGMGTDLIQYTIQGCGLTSLAKGTVLLMQCSLLVMAAICNLFKLPAIACLLFTKYTMGSLTFTNECCQRDRLLNVHQSDGTPIDDPPCLWNTRMTVYSWAEIQTQATQPWGKCAHLSAILSAHRNG